MDKVHVYMNGLVSCSVCAPASMSIEDITEAVNRLNVTGISSRWRLADEGQFADGTPMPAPCERSEGRWHYLFHC